eukprot:s6646_g8.t1
MEELAKQAGAGSVVRNYLTARGVLSVGTLSMLAKDDDDFEATIVEPLLRGFETDQGKLELEAAEKPIAKAVLLYMFHLAKAKEARSAAAPTTSLSSPATTSATPSGGVPREFPVQKLVGAESVLARFHWEHVTSEAYSPLELGELVSKRSFTATGGVNHLAARKKTTRLEFDGESLQTSEDSTWEPRSLLWSVVDGLDAIRWCHILFEVGEEHQINRFFEEMIRRARQHPDKASDAILGDVTMWNEYMAREPKDGKRRKRPELTSHSKEHDWPGRYSSTKGQVQKGKGKGKKGGKGRDWPGSAWRQWQPSSSWQRSSWQKQPRWTKDEASADE